MCRILQITIGLPSALEIVSRDKIIPRPTTVVLLVRSPSRELDLVLSNLCSEL